MLVKHSGGAWETAEPASYANEGELQALVEQTFQQVFAEISDDSPAVIVREAVMPDGGKIDLLAVDADGVITICECKRASNTQIRREVVGQVLEYAGWLNDMSLRDFRTIVEARLGGDLLGAMGELSDDAWDGEVWLEEVAHNLGSGEFRIMLAVDAIDPTLKQTVLYLNSHIELPLMAVEFRRSRRGDAEFLAPTVFTDERTRRRVRPAPTSTVEDADTVVVAARHALAEFERTQSYICQPRRSFRDGIEYMGFYANRRIEPFFPRILGRRPELPWTEATVERLRERGDALDARVAEVVERDLANPESRRGRGQSYQVVALDPERGFELDHAIRHEGGSAWLRGQRYTSTRALQRQPATTQELRAAGG